jgi:uncharacterized membrane protein YfcA
MKTSLFVIGLAGVAVGGVSLEHNGPTVGNLAPLLIGTLLIMIGTRMLIKRRPRRDGLTPRSNEEMIRLAKAMERMQHRRADDDGSPYDTRHGRK